MFARFDENPTMTLQDIKETKRYGRRTDNVKTVYPPQTKFAGGIIKPHWKFSHILNVNTFMFYVRRVAETQIFEKTYLIVIKDETGLKFKMNDSTLFLIGSYAQKLVASY